MSEVKITDLVDQATIDKIKELDKELGTLMETYTSVAKELAKGVDIPVKDLADIERLEKMLAEKTREATEATNKLNEVMAERSRVVNATTNTLARQKMEEERVNKEMRDAYLEHERVEKLLNRMNDTYREQLKALARIDRELEANKKAVKDNEKAYAAGKISADKYRETQLSLLASSRQLKAEKAQLNSIMKAEEKANLSADTSMAKMSQQLELLKKAYKELSEEGRFSEYGLELEATIQNLDAHLKDLSADIGEFQRNVGNYAITMRDGYVTTDSVTTVLEQQACSIADVSDKCKILSEAKEHLNKEDESYEDVLRDLNEQLDKYERELADVSDIMKEQPKTVAEAEEQNKRLAEALKHVDLSAEGAKDEVDRINEKIASNTKIIKENTKSLQDQDKENQGLANQMLSMIGINGNFASSLMSLKTEGNVWSGMGSKVKAFGRTLTGLLANPWVLTFLGISSVVAGVKWWYEYNKGLLEATKLTKNFTGMAGDDMKAYRTKIQTLADEIGIDFKDAISAANELVMQFGISWNEAAELMKDGYLVGANMHGKMIENINTYAGALKDAGVSAKEFIAIIANTKNGMFDERGLKAISDAGMRIRSMSAKTVAALETIGISSKKMQDDLKNGTISMTDALVQVTDKLKNLPPNSQEVGAVMKDVFGKKVAKNGIEAAEAIGSIETNLDSLKKQMSAAKKIDEQRIAVQEELNETVAAMFDMTDGGFQKMTAQAKLYIVQGLKSIVVWCMDVANWFIRMYNKSVDFRGAVEGVGYAFKLLWGVVKIVGAFVYDFFASLGEMIEGIVTADWDLFKKGLRDAMGAGGAEVNRFVTDATKGFETLKKNVEKGHLDEFTLKLRTTNAADLNVDNGSGTNNGDGETSEYETEQEKEKKRKEAEKAAEEQLKILADLNESKMNLMKEGHDKEILKIQLQFKKKIDEIKGHSKTEEALRIQLVKEMNEAIRKADEEYYREMASINLDNRLASVKEGSKEEFDLKMALLQAQHDAEIREAEKTGADVALINAKYEKQKIEMKEEYANKQSALIAQAYADENSKRDAALTLAEAQENKAYLAKIEAAKGNASEIERINAEHEENLLKIQEDYAMKSADAAIDMLTKQLAVEDLTAEERAQLENELAKAKADKEKQMADQAIAEMQRTGDADAKLKEKRLANIQMWLQTSADAFNQVNALAQAIFDAKIERVEKEQEANTAATEAEEARISDLASKKVITEEEAEARKRAAQLKSEKANAELEAKKQKLKERQAKWDRANAIAQVGIQTALAIMSALTTKPFPVGVAMAAIAGAMGAVQLATILATPIPKYAKGTDYHKGGPAVVGDGGRQEVVLFNNRAWITPDTPTVVDLPAGATVIPSVEMLTNNIVGTIDSKSNGVQMVAFAGKQNVVVDNTADNKRLEDRLDKLAYLLKQQTMMQVHLHSDREYEMYKNSRI